MEYSDFAGFFYGVPGPHHVSAGMLCRLGSLKSDYKTNRLNLFIRNHFPERQIIKKYRALLPSVCDPDYFDQPCCGDNWILLGDAAGHVDPITGEGIVYAMESGRLAAQAILSGDITSFDRLWRTSYGEKLKVEALILQDVLKLTGDFGPEMYGAMMYNFLVRSGGEEQ